MRSAREIADSLGGRSVNLPAHSPESEQLALQLGSIQIELLLDLRDQNGRIIALLESINEATQADRKNHY